MFGGQNNFGSATPTDYRPSAPFGQGLSPIAASSGFASASSQSVPFAFGSVNASQPTGMGLGMGIGTGMGMGMGASVPGDMNGMMGAQGLGQGLGAFALDSSATSGAARRKLKARGAGGSRR